MLLRHVRFISHVSIDRAEAFVDEFEMIVAQMKENPYRYPLEVDEDLPREKYRKAIFARWYKALYWINQDIVYLDAVCDCREDLSRVIQWQLDGKRNLTDCRRGLVTEIYKIYLGSAFLMEG